MKSTRFEFCSACRSATDRLASAESPTYPNSIRLALTPEVLNTDSADCGGSGHANLGGVEAAPLSHHCRPHLVNLTPPPPGAVFFRNESVDRHT